MTTPGFRPTHVVPQHGMPAWEAPDPSRPTVDLDPLLPVQLLERQGDWGHVLCFNGWSAWVDGRRLVAVPQDPPAADGPLTRAADPRPLLGRAQEALARYRSAVEDLAGGLDRESFRARTHGMRIGVVVDGESVWLYDSAHGHWVYADGIRMTTYATDDTPGAARPAPRPSVHPATRVVPSEGPGPAPRPGAAARQAEAPVHPPTRVVPPEGPGPVPASGTAARQADGSPPAPSAPAGPTRPAPPEAPEPTGITPPETLPPTGVLAPDVAEPTRVVPPEAPEPAGITPPETMPPTRVLAPDPPEPSRTAPPEAPPTRVVAAETPGAPPPTRVVSDREDERDEGGDDEEAGRASGAPPTRVVGHEPTRVVPPGGDGR